MQKGKTAKRQFLFAFWKTLCYTDKVFAPEAYVGIGVKADERSAFCVFECGKTRIYRIGKETV